MGNAPPAPQKTPRELQREMNRSVDRMLREFGRDKFRLQGDAARAKRELEKAVRAKEPRGAQRLCAQNIIRAEASLRKYELLEGKMKGVKLQIAQVSTTEAMVGVMRGMAELLGKASGGVNLDNVQRVIADFHLKLEEQEGVNELLSDAMEEDEEPVKDADVERYIDEVSDRLGGGKGAGGQKLAAAAADTTNFDQILDGLKR